MAEEVMVVVAMTVTEVVVMVATISMVMEAVVMEVDMEVDMVEVRSILECLNGRPTVVRELYCCVAED